MGCDVAVWCGGPSVLTIATTSVAVGLDLTSTYVAGSGVRVLVSEIVRRCHGRDELRGRTIGAPEPGPLILSRRFALLDHLATFTAEATELTRASLRFEQVEEAISELELPITGG